MWWETREAGQVHVLDHTRTRHGGVCFEALTLCLMQMRLSTATFIWILEVYKSGFVNKSNKIHWEFFLATYQMTGGFSYKNLNGSCHKEVKGVDAKISAK